ncbi:DUF5684 domain-containing protein [Frigoriglobus tundricola]|uniref:Signal peptidase I n=1 Tax=Frigoriglobus tundricola TaxID=2774151 RepID=A0A6M5YNX6_9BACT|nr:DUF5684 domain-containing protein [Frigoriglobus tundricola]QJW95779.1 hypothetical protein FTUN_3333 [Frigoriglobus tundricola]
MEILLAVLCPLAIFLTFFLVIVAGAWKVFVKAGQPGWASIVPVYNQYVFVVEIAKKDMVMFIATLFIPFVGIIPCMDVAEKFGKSKAYYLGKEVAQGVT